MPTSGTTPRRAPRWLWRGAAPLVFAAAGILFVTSAHVARGTDLRTGDRTSLADVITREQTRVEALGRQVKALRSDIDRTTTDQARRDSRLSSVTHEVDRIAPYAGMNPVTGPAVTVILDDAPTPAADQPLPDGVTVDSYVVHQQDVQAVVNALWAGGAEAMQLMDQRVISTSAVRCVGTTLLLQGRTYPPPYKITAIGNPEALIASLEASPEVNNYLDYVAYIGLGYEQRVERKVTIPGFTGSLDLRYARVAP